MPRLGSMPDPKDKPRTLLVGWISRLDLAVELGLSIDTLRRWEAQRTGPACVRAGRKVYYSSWPTPMSLHPGTDRYNPAGNSDFTCKAEALALGITNWSTPKGTDGAKGGPGQSYGSGGMPPLPAQAAQWPTPAAQNWKGSSPASVTRADGKSRMDILHYRAEQGFTRPDPVITRLGLQPSHHAPISRPLWASMIASHGRVVSRRILKARARRRLNPLFVGWLMGWPIGHALCACSAMEFTLWQQHMRGALSRLPMVSGPWIWRPTDGPEGPAQMNFFEGMLP